MNLPEVVVSIWVFPHHAYGHFIEIDLAEVQEGLPGGIFQSFADVQKHLRMPEFQPEFPYREFNVSSEQGHMLLQLVDQITYSFTEHSFTPMFGGSIHGLRVARGYQEVSVVWNGKYDDQDESVRKLYAAVKALAQA